MDKLIGGIPINLWVIILGIPTLTTTATWAWTHKLGWTLGIGIGTGAIELVIIVWLACQVLKGLT